MVFARASWVLFLLSSLARSSAYSSVDKAEHTLGKAGSGGAHVWPPPFPPPTSPPPPSAAFDIVVLSLIVLGLMALMCLIRVVWTLFACSWAVEETVEASPVAVRIQKSNNDAEKA